MTIQRVNNEEQRGFRPQVRLQKVGCKNIQEFLFIGKTNVLLGHVGVLDRRWCAQAHSTAQKTHGATMEAMAKATWEMRANVACTRSHLLGSSVVRLITPSALEHIGRDSKSSLCLIPPFKPHFHTKDLQHKNTQKLN